MLNVVENKMYLGNTRIIFCKMVSDPVYKGKPRICQYIFGCNRKTYINIFTLSHITTRVSVTVDSITTSKTYICISFTNCIFRLPQHIVCHKWSTYLQKIIITTMRIHHYCHSKNTRMLYFLNVKVHKQKETNIGVTLLTWH